MKENRLLFFWVFGLLSALILIYLTFDYQDNGGIYFIKNNQSTLFQFAAMLSQWDGGNYIQIIQNGYSNEHFFAFFPLYPGFIRAFSAVINPVFLGISLSFASLIIFLYFLQKYCSVKYAKQEKIITLSVLTFPSAFIFVCVYPESLFLALTCLSAYLFFTRREYFPAVVFASLASVTRVQGIVFLALIIIWTVRLRMSLIQKLTLSVLSLVPILVFLVYQKIYLGSYFGFVEAQIFWQRFQVPKLTLQFDYLGFVAINNLVFAVFALVIFKYFSHKLNTFDKYYLLILLIFPIFTGSLDSYPRYLLSAYPFFVLIAQLIQLPKVKFVYLPIVIFLQAVFLSLFVSGYWIF